MTASPWDSLLLANVFIWRGIALCIIQSAAFPGLNLAIFSVSNFDWRSRRWDASGLLALRKKSNLTLASVLWGNVAINVLLTLLPIPSLPASRTPGRKWRAAAPGGS